MRSLTITESGTASLFSALMLVSRVREMSITQLLDSFMVVSAILMEPSGRESELAENLRNQSECRLQ